jgi:hypothetical protein
MFSLFRLGLFVGGKMKYILIAILSSCAAIPGGPPEGNNCGVIAAGDYDSRGGYVEGL